MKMEKKKEKKRRREEEGERRRKNGEKNWRSRRRTKKKKKQVEEKGISHNIYIYMTESPRVHIPRNCVYKVVYMHTCVCAC